MNPIIVKYLISALIFSGFGIAVLLVCFLVFEWLTPRTDLWRELVDKQNLALSIFLAGGMIGISLIISAAIHG